MAPLTIDTPARRAALTEADRLAEQNFRANVTRLRRRQPSAADAAESVSLDLTWVFARDGYLTAFDPGGRWHTGCSVPLLAARAMLKTFEAAGSAACFLNPRHAAEIRVALEHLKVSQTLICIVPDPQTLSVILHCDDFTGELSCGRLWFACGEQWAAELGRLMEDVPGLPTPTRFVRMPLSEPSLIDRLIAEAQRVFSEQSTRRAARMAALREQWTQNRGDDHKITKVCVIAPSMFRLWDDAGHSLHAAIATNDAAELALKRFDPDDPSHSSPLALAMAAAGSDAIIAADLARGDAPRVAPDELPWITWVTTPRIPPFQPAGPNDRLLLADPAWGSAMEAAGWPAKRISLAAWPTTFLSNVAQRPGLAMIADTCSLDAPEVLSEFSSHCLLWEKIRQRVLCDPFSLPNDVEGWLGDRARADGIAVETLDMALFVNRLIVPAYQQALAGALIAAAMPIQLHGAGWCDLPRFRSHAAGPIASREQLGEIARDAAALVHAWPRTGAHPIDTLGRPVVRRGGRRAESFLRNAKLALEGAPTTPLAEPLPVLSPALLISLLS